MTANEIFCKNSTGFNVDCNKVYDEYMNCTNSSDPNSTCIEPALYYDDDIMKYAIFQTVMYILYITIFTIGVVGNCLVCFIVFRKKTMRNVTNFFIVNLALSDILLCVISVPLTPIYFVMGRWAFGRILCKLLPMVQSVSVYISSFTLTSIAVDRYFVILFPFRKRLDIRYCYTIIFLIWFTSIILTLPYGIFMDQEIIHGVYYCEEFWPTELIRRIFGALTTILQFFIPFWIVLYCYVRIFRRMNQRAMTRPGSRSANREEADRDKKRRMNRMLIAMVLIFGCLWSPLNIINLISDYHMHAGRWKYFNMFFFLTHSMAMSTTCYNPFLYAYLNDAFRKEFQTILPCCEERPDRMSRNRWNSERTCNGTDVRRSTRRGSPRSTVFTSSSIRKSIKEAPEVFQVKSHNNLSTVEEGFSGEPDDVFLMKAEEHASPTDEPCETQMTTFTPINKSKVPEHHQAEDIQNYERCSVTEIL